jgi:hypothetical protein
MNNVIASHRCGLSLPPRLRLILCGLLTASLLPCLAGGPYPEPLSSRRDVISAKLTLDYIDIRYLPLEDYPLLSRFRGLRRIKFYNREGKGATDQKLEALAELKLTNIFYIDLTNCREVSDAGIRALAGIPSVKQLMLEGTAITDAGCRVMGSEMALEVVNVANCAKITGQGLKELAVSSGLGSIRFSADGLTQDDVLGLIASLKAVSWCEIVDPHGKLDQAPLKALGAEKKMHVSVLARGALQDMKLVP